MKKVAWFIASVAALLPDTSVSSQAPNPSGEAVERAAQVATIGVVPIYLSGRRPLAVVSVNGHPAAPVIFDTGTDGNTLDTDYATTLGLEYDPSVEVEVGDGTGNFFKAREAKIANATLGGVAIQEKRATVHPYKERDVVGIFGPNSFIGKLVLLDLGNGRMIVKDKEGTIKAAPPSSPYLGSLPAIDIELPGMTVPALLDSGNDSPLILPDALAGKLPLQGPLRIAGRVSTVTGERDFYEGDIVGDIRIGNVVLKNPRVIFSGKDANIGLPIMRQLLIALDPKEKRAWLFEQAVLRREQLTEYEGQYGVRSIRLADGTLTVQRENFRRYVLRPLGDDIFVVEGNADVLQFRREGSRIVGLNHVSGGSGIVTTSCRTLLRAN